MTLDRAKMLLGLVHGKTRHDVTDESSEVIEVFERQTASLKESEEFGRKQIGWMSVKQVFLF